ncbi:MAG: alcohol dehydrogenase catalytic domain-containing protein [Verrucomicrobiota bacterium]|nr:alcohol dehydrogenase catalytic domain-containing protein [Verrucomicrobiota bacterium]
MPVIPKTMRAVVYRGADDLRLERVPVPEIGANELLVKVAVCGVCPTDIKKIHYGTIQPPRIFGHETAGTIVKAGLLARRAGFRVGERVALHHHVPCLECRFCRHRAHAQCETYKRTGITAGFEPAGGGFAEYARVMGWVLPGVVRIPAKNSFAEGAMLEPVNTVLKAVKRLNVMRGDRVMVAGQGPIGLMFTKILQLRGVQVLATDLLESRLKLARKFGAKWTANAREMDHQKGPGFGAGMDAAVIAVPSDAAVSAALGLVRGGGQVLLFAHTRRAAPGGFDSQAAGGAGIDFASICLDEKDLIGSYSADFTIQQEVARLVFSRQLDVRGLISHRFPLEKTASAVALAAKPTEDSLKIIVASGNEG